MNGIKVGEQQTACLRWNETRPVRTLCVYDELKTREQVVTSLVCVPKMKYRYGDGLYRLSRWMQQWESNRENTEHKIFLRYDLGFTPLWIRTALHCTYPGVQYWRGQPSEQPTPREEVPCDKETKSRALHCTPTVLNLYPLRWTTSNFCHLQ